MRFLLPLALTLFLALNLRVSADDPAPAEILVSFDNAIPMEILPRRSHQTLKVTSYNIRTLDATILHAPEADTLAAIDAARQPGPPSEAVEIWHGPIEATAADGGPARAGQKAVTGINALKLVPALQPGVYYLVVKSDNLAKAVQPFLITNLGIQAFDGADGVSTVVRLLSEAKPAQNVEVALISGNNREIARIRTGIDGVARFDKAASNGIGRDAPAAIYAYGADGEFSAVSMAGAGLLDSRPPQSSADAATAWIAIDRGSYKPGQAVRGLAIIRQTDGKQFQGAANASLIGHDGHILEQQPLSEEHGGIASFTLHAPAGGQSWTIRLVSNDGRKLGVLDPFMAKPGTDEVSVATMTDKAAPVIQLGAGRRTFQPGETANISVQPPETSEVTLAVIDRSVHAIMTQHIDKAGGVVQIPLPANATGGVFVFASSTTAPDEATGTPIHRSYGLQWLDIDQGTRRVGVRLDLPDSVQAGSNIPVHVTLSDNQTAKADFAVIGTAADKPSGIDPFAQIYARRAPQVGIFEDFSAVQSSSGNSQAPDLAALILPNPPVQAQVLLWTGVQDAPGGSANPLIALPGTVPTGRLRLSIVAANEDAVGFAESGIDIKPATGRKIVPSTRLAPPSDTLGMLQPHAILTIEKNAVALTSPAPIVAAPLWVSSDGSAHFMASTDPDALELLRSFVDTIDRDDLALDLLLAEAMDAPAYARGAVRQQLIAAVHRPDYPQEQLPLALFALYHAGDLPLWAEPSVAAPMPATAGWLAHLCRYGLTHNDTDLAAIPETETSDDLEQQISTVLVTRLVDMRQRKVELPEGLLEDIAQQAFRHNLDARTRLGLRAVQAALVQGPSLRPEWDDAPVLVDETVHSSLFVIRASDAGDVVSSGDKRALHSMTLSHWPDTPPE